jgi:L-ascorbate metabolism protein UlaG (beta-lactamase superfamily)
VERYHAPRPAQNHSARPFGLSRRDRRGYNSLPTGSPNFTAHFRASTRNATHIPLTHAHDDHIGDTPRIAYETGANFDLCMWLEGQGAQKINSGNTGGDIRCGNFLVSLTDARHSASTIEGGAPVYLGPANGLVVESAEAPTLYHMGDTGIFGDMALISELYQPKIGLVPTGGRFTMDGAMAALAVERYFDFETVIPCHYGTFDAIAPDASEFIAAMQGSRTRVWRGAIGESLEV